VHLPACTTLPSLRASTDAASFLPFFSDVILLSPYSQDVCGVPFMTLFGWRPTFFGHLCTCHPVVFPINFSQVPPVNLFGHVGSLSLLGSSECPDHSSLSPLLEFPSRRHLRQDFFFSLLLQCPTRSTTTLVFIPFTFLFPERWQVSTIAWRLFFFSFLGWAFLSFFTGRRYCDLAHQTLCLEPSPDIRSPFSSGNFPPLFQGSAAPSA